MRAIEQPAPLPEPPEPPESPDLAKLSELADGEPAGEQAGAGARLLARRGVSRGLIDGLNRGVRRSAVHEWFGVAGQGDVRPDAAAPPRRFWSPPLCVLTHLAWQAMARDGVGHRRVLWIGPRCWPHARVLVCDGLGGRRLLKRSIFADPPDAASRLWAIDLALRSGAVVAVVADGSGMDMAATRRLQLAAEAGRAPALLARPPHELSQLSAADTRWLVRADPEPARNHPLDPTNLLARAPPRRPRWIIELRRCKRARTYDQTHATPRWALEWHRGNHAVVVSADLVDRPGRSSSSQAGSDVRSSLRSA